MLNKVALALAVLIVVVLAAILAISISDRIQSESDEEEDNASTTTEPDRTIIVDDSGRPVAVSCDIPPDDNTPLLVTFINDTTVTADYTAQVTVLYGNGRAQTAIAEAVALRAGENRAVIPEPWPDDAEISSCRLDAIQRGEHLVLLSPDS